MSNTFHIRPSWLGGDAIYKIEGKNVRVHLSDLYSAADGTRVSYYIIGAVNIDYLNLPNDVPSKFKPILRSLSSITNEEMHELVQMVQQYGFVKDYGFLKIEPTTEFFNTCVLGADQRGVLWEYHIDLNMFFMRHKFDMDGLISQELAYDEKTVKLMGL